MTAREMKDSLVWGVGKIPCTWTTKNIGYLFTEQTRLSLPEEEWELLSVSEYYGVAPKREKISGDDFLTRAESLVGYKVCQVGDLVSNIMLTWKGALGVSDYQGIVSPAYCVYRPNEELVPRYAHYLFRTKAYTSLFKAYSSGVIDSRLRLYTDKFFKLKCLLPSKNEQSAIVNFLDTKCAEIDSLTVDIEKQIETLQEYKNSVITEAVTKGLNQKVEMKDSGVEWIGDIPIDWNMKTLSRVCQGFQNGTTETQLSYGESEYPVTRIETISQGVIDYSKVGFVSRISKKYLLKKNDFLISNINSIANIGKSAMYYGEAPLYHGMNLLRISPKEVEPMFLKYFFKSNYFLCTAQRLCKPAINQASLANSLLKRIKMPVPPVVEQAIIANFLDSKCAEIDATIEEKQKQLETLAQYKQSLIYEYVTGKKAVPM